MTIKYLVLIYKKAYNDKRHIAKFSTMWELNNFLDKYNGFTIRVLTVYENINEGDWSADFKHSR